jgi:hypothetical protein
MGFEGRIIQLARAFLNIIFFSPLNPISAPPPYNKHGIPVWRRSS